MVFEIKEWEDFGNPFNKVEDCPMIIDEGCCRMTTIDKRLIGKR